MWCQSHEESGFSLNQINTNLIVYIVNLCIQQIFLNPYCVLIIHKRALFLLTHNNNTYLWGTVWYFNRCIMTCTFISKSGKEDSIEWIMFTSIHYVVIWCKMLQVFKTGEIDLSWLGNVFLKKHFLCDIYTMNMRE